ncbi:MAG: hypothetical protein KJ737_09805 [Proteobacteria bacterium]|nr:hypothetical protein [Pseudomonadota bacterium]
MIATTANPLLIRETKNLQKNITDFCRKCGGNCIRKCPSGTIRETPCHRNNAFGLASCVDAAKGLSVTISDRPGSRSPPPLMLDQEVFRSSIIQSGVLF